LEARRVNLANWGTETVSFESLPQHRFDGTIIEVMQQSATLAYVVGIALGDGNLSCPNGRATRLRVSCDTSYPNLITEISKNLQDIFPNNKVSICAKKKGACVDVSVYSNTLNEIIPWKVGAGSKIVQQARVPDWIHKNKSYTRACLRGLLQTDGSIYFDRSYRMVNFTNLIKPLIEDVNAMIISLGYSPHIYQSTQRNGNVKYVVRLSKLVDEFTNEIALTKD
jgi:hypothetical protein